MTEYEMNVKVAEEICNTLHLNGTEFHLGECVGLLDGKVVGVAKDLAGAVKAVRALDSDVKRGLVFQVGPQVDYIR